ncbi:ligand-binding sensor protein [Treponema rectale]|uniref:Ligand-binding sensor protein n=1 Tax=Treponema rectale TaxID=744512 RepID=A0A840SCG3_9SPIR|nr:PocR ligand-binding domain-containing protein [Treponema rectale]MBB5219467.1 ligand-binding sensor protein [Treponema rectale]
MSTIRLTDLIDKKTLQKIQDVFSRFTGIASLITDRDGIPITKGSGFTTFCSKMNRSSKLGENLCRLCDKKGTLKAIQEGKVSVYTCHAGLIECAMPITINDELAGCFIGGQVRPPEIDEALLRRRAIRLNLDPDEYIKEAYNTKEKNPREVARAAEFLGELAGVISTMALKNYTTLQNTKMMEKASKAQAVFISDMARKMEEAIKHWTSDISSVAKMEDFTQVKKRVSEIADQGSELYSIVADSMSFIDDSEGKAALYEKVYSPAVDFTITANGLKKILPKNSPELIFNVEDSVPEFILGDVTRISQILFKLTQDAILQSDNSKVRVSFSAQKKGYATMLILTVENQKSRTADEEIKFISDYFSTGSKAFLVHKIITEMGLPLVYMLIHQLSGTFSISKDGSGTVTTVVSIPQLEDKGDTK